MKDFRHWARLPEERLAEVARELIREFRPGAKVLLEGSLGAGKTALAREVLRQLGSATGTEGSPTFALVHEVELPSGRMAHIDLYRIRDAAELDAAGISEWLADPAALVLVEWASLHEAHVLSCARGLPLIRVTIGVDPGAETRSYRVESSGVK